MIDFAALMMRTRGMIVDPEQTLARHVSPAPPWTVVAREHVVPLVVLSALISGVLLLLFAPMLAVNGPPSTDVFSLIVQLILRIAVNILMLGVFAGVVKAFSGMFGGSTDFNASFALVGLAMTPLFVGEAIMPIPLLGVVAGLGGLIYALVLLYRGTTIALGLPQDNRAKHFLLSLVSMLLILIVAGLMIGPMLMS